MPEVDKYRTELPPKDKTPGLIVLAVVLFLLGAAWLGYSSLNTPAPAEQPATTDHCAGC